MIWTHSHLVEEIKFTEKFLLDYQRQNRYKGEDQDHKHAVAVIGGGPKGLYALDHLLQEYRKSTKPSPLEILWFNSDEHFGSGPNYQVDQPDYLLINYCLGHINAFLPQGNYPHPTPCLKDWLSAHETLAQDVMPTDYTSRALVGRYLQFALQQLLSHIPEGISIKLIANKVENIQWDGLKFYLKTGAKPIVVNDALLCTGHCYDNPPLINHRSIGERYLKYIYPISSLATIPARSKVGIVGMGLTFIDAVLALTEGRGGHFKNDGTYMPSGEEPLLFPCSRHQLPILPRGPQYGANQRKLFYMNDDWIQQLRTKAANRPLDFEEEILPTLQKEVQFAFYSTALKTHNEQKVWIYVSNLSQEERFDLNTLLFPKQEAQDVSNRLAIHYIEESLTEARKGELDSPLMAAASVWRQFTPFIQELYANRGFNGTSHEKLDNYYFPAFCRVSFGPPIANMQKILSLAKAGILHFSFLFYEAVQFQYSPLNEGIELVSGKHSRRVDYLLDARVARPHLAGSNSSFYDGLKKERLIQPMQNEHYQPGCVDMDLNGRIVHPAGDMMPLYAYGTSTEGFFLDNDSLSRTKNNVANQWAQAVIGNSRPIILHPILHPWVRSITAQSTMLSEKIEEWGSPLNLHHLTPFRQNMKAYQTVFEQYGLDYRIYFARKANKCLAFCTASVELGQGVDTASYRELAQCLEAGIAADRLILTAAIKNRQLLELAVKHGVTIVVDNQDELELLLAVCQNLKKVASINIRLGGFQLEEKKLPSRFGFDPDNAERVILSLQELPSLQYTGLHFHLNGYSIEERAEAAIVCIRLIDKLQSQGVKTNSLDIGGGMLVRYLQYKEEWEHFHAALREAALGKRSALTYGNDALGMIRVENNLIGNPHVYPYFNELNKEQFLDAILRYPTKIEEKPLYELLRERNIQLRIEPGRSLLDQAGITIARVIFRKQDSEGNQLVGLEMNRTQLRSSSADFLLDPILLPINHNQKKTSAAAVFLVGGYCLEQEFILKRKIHFDRLPAVGDLILFPNTAGYMTHFFESEAHQFELAKNIFVENTGIPYPFE